MGRRASGSGPLVSEGALDPPGPLAARMEDVSVEGGGSGRDKGMVPAEGFTVLGEGKRPCGFAGRVDPERVDAPAWAGPVWGLEWSFHPNPGPDRSRSSEPPPAFPGVDRDLALLLPKGPSGSPRSRK